MLAKFHYALFADEIVNRNGYHLPGVSNVEDNLVQTNHVQYVLCRSICQIFVYTNIFMFIFIVLIETLFLTNGA